MCHVSCTVFVARCLAKSPDLAAQKRVLEVGSFKTQIRDIVMELRPAEYLGVDYRIGPGVDSVVDAERLSDKFADERFDLILSTETLEHVRDWRAAVISIKRLCARGGAILLTTRSRGFPYHGAPHDYWRFSAEDMKAVFGDWNIDVLVPDMDSPGVFILAHRPVSADSIRVPPVSIYSIVYHRSLRATVHPDVSLIRQLSLISGAELDRLIQIGRRVVRRGD
jgi:SAM-dependent methyltransferase